MYNFISFLERRDDDLWFRHYETISEMSMAELETRKPKDGRWENDNTYVFNVEGDDSFETLVRCGFPHCYVVNFSRQDDHTFISFNRRGRGREYKDERRGFGNQVFIGVQYAIMEFVKKNNPSSLAWSPIKTQAANPVTGKITNPEGRRDAYEIMALKSLFPDLYVSTEMNRWIRRDIYDKEYVQKQGFPEIPQGLTNASNPSEKKKILAKIRSKLTNPLRAVAATSLRGVNPPDGIQRPWGWRLNNFWVKVGPCSESGEILVQSEFGRTGDIVIVKKGECTVAAVPNRYNPNLNSINASTIEIEPNDPPYNSYRSSLRSNLIAVKLGSMVDHNQFRNGISTNIPLNNLKLFRWEYAQWTEAEQAYNAET